MTLNTFVAGNPGSLRECADAVRGDAGQSESYAGAWHHTRSGAEPVWDGTASENYQHYATRQGRSGDDLERVLQEYARAVDDLADSLAAAQARMHQAEETARKGELTVVTHAIYPPTKPAAPLDPDPIQVQQNQAMFAHQQQAFRDAQALVQDARAIERTAHDRMAAADNAAMDGTNTIPQRGEWEQMAATATSPTAAALSKAATDLDTRSTTATRAQFEKALASGPFAVRGMWGSLTTAQRAEMTSHFPQLVGSTNGVPTAARDKANRSILDRQRTQLQAAISDSDRTYSGEARGPYVGSYFEKKSGNLRKALAGLDRLEAQLGSQGSGKYLLGLKGTENNRGQAIIANGNPDDAEHVVTYVPGTGSDLSNATEDIQRNDILVDRARQMAPDQSVAGVTWVGYETPPDVLPQASMNGYAYDGRQDLSDFQEGLRATHNGPEPSHNTLLSHSYGTTLSGETAHDYGAHSDDLVFVGSPGVDVNHADQLGVPADHVWAGTSGDDDIHYATSLLNGYTSTDDHWFGMNPADPAFGGHVIPTDPTTQHGEYWNKPVSLDHFSQIVTGQGQTGMPQ